MLISQQTKIRTALHVIVVVIFLLVPVNVLSADEPAIPREHPRLFLNRKDLAELRFRCGRDRYRDDPVARSRGLVFGSQREVLNRLRKTAFEIMSGTPRTDDLWVPAMLHLATGELNQADSYTQYVLSRLLDPTQFRPQLDGVVALDHCWDALPQADRERIVNQWSGSLRPLEMDDQPFDEIRFVRKLTSLALALTLHGESVLDGKPKLAGKVNNVIAAAGQYLEGPFVSFCRQRGVMPTAGGQGASEEAALVLAVELWRSGAGRSLWPRLADSLGRSMEHYFYADTETAELTHGFIHDFGSDIPLRPVMRFRGFIPAVPAAIARHTRDPIATWYAHRSLTAGPQHDNIEQARYLWVRLLYGPLDQAEAARGAYPLARHFGGGWVVMRSGWEPGETVILFDGGQPHWQARQHFDAGQFQIYRKGRLALDSGDDVTYEAVPARGGETTINGKRGDWDRFFQATIAHNCITLEDRLLRQSLYGKPWPALGNQRLIGYDYDLSAGDVAKTPRITGRLTAFETNTFYSYAAADLSAAYLPQIARAVERRLLFLHEGVLIVLDRVQTTEPHVLATWHLQLPARPRLLEIAQPAAWGLDRGRQLDGKGRQSGIWALPDQAKWVEVTEGKGRLFVQTLLPQNATRRVVGGPMERKTVPEGPRSGCAYVGSTPTGYEYRLAPAVFLKGANAAYKLGRPMNLGPQFGVGAAWGRLDISPRDSTENNFFLHILIPADADVTRPPTVEFTQQEKLAILNVGLKRLEAHVELDLQSGTAGRVCFRERGNDHVVYEKELTDVVQSNESIPRIDAAAH